MATLASNRPNKSKQHLAEENRSVPSQAQVQHARPAARPRAKTEEVTASRSKTKPVAAICGSLAAAAVAVAAVFFFVLPAQQDTGEEAIVDTTPREQGDGFLEFDEAAAQVPTADDAVESFDVSGSAETAAGQGVEISVQPSSLELLPGQEFGVTFTLEVTDAIGDVAEITVPRLSALIQEAVGLPDDSAYRFNDTQTQVSGNMQLRVWDDEIEMMGFKPGDKVEFSTYGVCPDGAEAHEADPIEIEVFGDSGEMYSGEQFIGYSNRDTLATATLGLSVM